MLCFVSAFRILIMCSHEVYLILLDSHPHRHSPLPHHATRSYRRATLPGASRRPHGQTHSRAASIPFPSTAHRLGRSCECVCCFFCTDPAIPPPTPTPAYRNSLPSLGLPAQRLRRERLRRVSVSRPTFGSSAECAFPLHPSDSAPCFSALPAPAKPTS